MRAAAVALLALLAAGCGFHLRGAPTVDPLLSTVTVRDAAAGARGQSAWYGSSRDELRHVVARALEATGATVVADAPVVVEILAERVARRTAAVGASTNAAEYRLEYELRYRVTGSDGSTLVPETLVRRDGNYRYDETAALGSAEEEILLRRELREDAARLLARQYRLQAARRAASADEAAVPAAPATPEADETAAP